MTRSEKPTFSQLLDWLEGRLDDEEARRLEDRLRTAGAETDADLGWLRSFLDASGAARLAAPPAEVRRDLLLKFETFTRARRAPGLLARLIATLTFDSAAGLAPAGVRSVQTQGKQRQLIYETDVAEIALNIFPNSQDENLTLTGQIFPKTDLHPAGLSVQIIDPDTMTELGLTVTNELGEFTLSGIPQGRYGIFISSEGLEVALPAIYLQR